MPRKKDKNIKSYSECGEGLDRGIWWRKGTSSVKVKVEEKFRAESGGQKDGMGEESGRRGKSKETMTEWEGVNDGWRESDCR